VVAINQIFPLNWQQKYEFFLFGDKICLSHKAKKIELKKFANSPTRQLIS